MKWIIDLLIDKIRNKKEDDRDSISQVPLYIEDYWQDLHDDEDEEDEDKEGKIIIIDM